MVKVNVKYKAVFRHNELPEDYFNKDFATYTSWNRYVTSIDLVKMPWYLEVTNAADFASYF